MLSVGINLSRKEVRNMADKKGGRGGNPNKGPGKPPKPKTGSTKKK